ncbi:MAG TPA: hypothetical protein VGR07_12670, partial [Thermoanaerobaculia bacterium]|nr:hypothetical protein [Thermoanaerobaculia bacterium]
SRLDRLFRRLQLVSAGLYSTVIADLFKGNGKNPLEILKWKEVYEGLEDACDECKDFTHAVGNVLVKNS